MFDGYKFHHGPVTIVVENGRISAVQFGSAGDTENLPFTDLGESTLMPGLVDAHTHLCWDPNGRPEDLADSPFAELVERARRNATMALRAGVTTVRDLGDRDYATLALREECRRDVVRGPEILVAGPPLTPTGGHCWYLNGEADDTGALLAGVKERVERGVDWIKVMVTGGFVTAATDPTQLQYSRDQLAAMVEAAHSAGLPVTAHAHATAGIAAAVAAGVDGVEHCTFLGEDGLAFREDVVQALIDNKVWCGVTVSRGLPGTSPKVLAVLSDVRSNIRKLIDAGANVVFSSDAGVNPAKTHDCLPYELAHLDDHGFTSAEILMCSTANAAASCGVGDRKGRIAPGYDADLLAVAPNLEDNLLGICDVRSVWRNGELVDQS